MTGGHAVGRRSLLHAAGLAGVLAALSACAAPFAERRLVLGTGGTQGVYFNLGTALAEAWRVELELEVPPVVLPTSGSVDNLSRLASRGADIVFSQIDTAADELAGSPPDSAAALRALARIYDDAVHVVVRAASPLTTLSDLRGARVSVGAANSGVYVIATRMLQVAGLSPATDMTAVQLGINESLQALREARIDAFFWSGGLPTQGITDLSAAVPIRLLDLADVVGDVRAAHPVYATGTVPATTYGIAAPITTLLVRNVLLVRSEMPDDLAGALVRALFDTQEQLARVSPSALTIDPRAAIGTQPVPLHPGAEQFYRATENS